ncbi:MAG: dTMP kinase [Clostridia bacterium]|nr:dTMP kinase [Clostridia bacterium]
MKGKFIVFEGIDGSGKSTQIKRLAKRLEEMGVSCYETREPTDSPAGSLVHHIMIGRTTADERVIAALFMADRVDHLTNPVDGLMLQIDKGVTVISDRYYFSSYAYHGVELDMDWIINGNSISADILRPTATVFLDIPVETAMERINSNRSRKELYEKADRLAKVRAKYFEAFDKLRDVETVEVVDANADADTVEERIWAAVSKYFEGDE